MAVENEGKYVQPEQVPQRGETTRTVPANILEAAGIDTDKQIPVFDLALGSQVTGRKIDTPGAQDWFRVKVVPDPETSVSIRVVFTHPPLDLSDPPNSTLAVVPFAVQGDGVVDDNDLGSAMAHGSPGDGNLGSAMAHGDSGDADETFGPFDQPRAYYICVLGAGLEVTNSGPYALVVEEKV